MLMDEPLAAVDQPTKIGLLSALRQIHQDFALPIIYVSHDLATVLNFASDVILMRNGKIVATGNPFEILSDYFSSSLSPDEFRQNVIRAILVAADKKTGLCRVAAGAVELLLPFFEGTIRDCVYLEISASDIILATQKPQGLSARNILYGRVRAIQHIGERVFVEVDAGIKLRVEIVEKTIDALALQAGARVYLIIKATSFRKVT